MFNFFTGAIDAAYAGETPFLLARSYGLRVQVVAVAQEASSGHGVCLAKEHPSGRLKIGTVFGSMGHLAGSQWAASVGESPVFVNLDPGEQLKAFEYRFIDGIASWEPYLTFAEQAGGTRAFDASVAGECFNLICVTESFARQCGKAVHDFVQVHDRATELISQGLTAKEAAFLRGIFDDRLSEDEYAYLLRTKYSWPPYNFMDERTSREAVMGALERSYEFLQSCNLAPADRIAIEDCFPATDGLREGVKRDAETLRVGYSDSLMCAPFYLARALDMYGESGFDFIADEARVVERVAKLGEDIRGDLRSSRELLLTDADLALVKIGRINEDLIGRVYRIACGADPPKQLSRTLEDLQQREILPSRVATSSHWIRNMRNHAAHGEGGVTRRDAERAYENLVDVLEWFQANEDALTRRCPKCGLTQDPSWVLCPRCGLAHQAHCSSCNSELQMGWKMCPLCGARVQQGD